MLTPNLKKLLAILNDGKYHSGTEIGKQLSLTRSSIWKLMKQLEALDLNIHSSTNKGYCLATPIELLDKKIIKQAMDQENLKTIDKFIFHHSLPSTNDFLIDYAKQHKPETVVCLAEQQTAGRGRLGRQWVSPFAENIYLSLLWHFPSTELAGLNIVVGVSIADAIRSLSALPIQLKWPNDIYLQDAKAGGVLIDVMSELNGNSKVIIGIGLNLKMSASHTANIDKPWTNLHDQHLSRNQLVGVLLNILISNLKAYHQIGISDFLNSWKQIDYLYDKQIKINTPTQQFAGIAKGVDKHGCLILLDESHTKRSIASGDASVLLSA